MSRIAIRSLLLLLVGWWSVLLEAQEQPRAINSTGLWSKYNLIVRPELKSPASPSQPASSTTSSPSSAAPRWEEEEEYGQDIPDDEQEIEDSEEDKDEDEEEEQVYIPHTTQRSKGDSGKRRRPSSSSHHKTSKHTRKGYKGTKGLKGFKKLKKYMFPLLIAYKLKFFTLIPLLLGGLVLIVATTGFAGFFFALFAVGVGLKKD